MLNIWEGKTHVLVCTTIIENGIDLPNVNTMFINDAYKMGLAQPINSVDESVEKRAGYCTLLVPNRVSVGYYENDRAQEYTALGSGFASPTPI